MSQKNKNDTEASGNTIAAASVSFLRSRSFQLTLNQPEKYNAIKNYFMGLKNLSYWLAGKEYGKTTKHEHIHIYIHFSKPFKLNIKNCLNAHIEICKGSPKQNIDYIRKPESTIIDEWGEIPHQGQLTITNVELMNNDERKNLPLVYYNIIRKINEKQNNELTLESFKKEIKAIYIWGESGVGKTTLATKIINKYIKDKNIKTFNLIKHDGNFWVGVGESKIALYDDFRDSHMKPSEFINLIDYNIHNMNIKNGSVKNKYEVIILTSVQSPELLYSCVTERDQEPKKQWLRRLNIIHLLNFNDINNYLNI